MVKELGADEKGKFSEGSPGEKVSIKQIGRRDRAELQEIPKA